MSWTGAGVSGVSGVLLALLLVSQTRIPGFGDPPKPLKWSKGDTKPTNICEAEAS